MTTRILLNFPHGLGDTVQLTVVLKHLRKYRPDWEVTVRCGRGKHTALTGLCAHVCHDQGVPPPGPFDTECTLGWYENYCNYRDRPNSKITNCLSEVFGLDYDAKLGRYEIQLGDDARARAAAYLRGLGAKEVGPRFAAVVLHYEGNTSPGKKNLGHWQAQALCELAIRCGRVPIILDWDNRSTLPDGKRIFTPATGNGDIWGGFGSGDAETIAALVSLSEAYIGIDSGPGKAASATDTPTLICWREHHPVQFHDPAANTVHLVKRDHRQLPPASAHPEIGDYFEKHYLWRGYAGGEHGLVAEALAWLGEVLGHRGEAAELTPVLYALPNGIGDVMWALLKIKSIAGGRPIDLVLSGDPRRPSDSRALPFVARFPFVRSASVSDFPLLEGKDREANDDKGRYRYLSDGVRGCYHYLVPNRTLEAGGRLEEWLPQFPLDWKTVDDFNWEGTQRGTELGKGLSPFVAFYLGPEAGNVDEGHNRGFLWEPKHWNALGKALTNRGLRVALVGAEYDRSYYERYVRDGVRQEGMEWYDLIGKLEIGETFAFLRECKCFISYQCGLGIFAHYLGVRVCMFWRPDGDSCHPERLVSFDERMATSWTNPHYADRYMGLIYKKCDPWSILGEMEDRGWLT